MAPVEVRLLGEPMVAVAGRPVDVLTSPRLLSLIGLLVVNRATPVRRQRVAFGLWPDSTESQARTNLRQALHYLRRALPDADAHLDVDGPTLAWRADSPACIDIVALEDAVARADASGDRALLEQAVAAYGGDLLPGCYDDWVPPVRTRLRDEHVGRLDRLAASCAQAGDLPSAIHWTQRLVATDPVNEAGYRRLMALYGRTDRARALRAYHACVTTLARELGVRPGAETAALYERLLDDEDVAPVQLPPRPTTDMLGRDDAWQAVTDAVRGAMHDQCRLVLVHGEAGIGKSRLVAELTAWCERQSIATATAYAYQAEGRLPYAPLGELLRSAAVRPALERVAMVWRKEMARVAPELWGAAPADPAPGVLDGTEQARLFTALGQAFAVFNRPLVVVVEDLHWCDAETLEFLHFLVRSSAGRPLVVVGTVRDQEALGATALTATIGSLRRLDALVDVSLQHLSPTVAGELVRQLRGDEASDEAVERIVTEAGGNPLFLVEMASARLAGTDQVTLPRKVQDVIDARLASVSAGGRRLLDVGAVIGRPFDLGLVGRIAGAHADEIAPALDEVWHRGLIVEVGIDGYDFSHHRIRDVAYERIGPASRRRLHRAVADALAERADERDAGAIAVHYERAGDVLPALDHFQRAVDVARRVFAHDEVIALVERSLELLDRLPAGADRARREVTLLGALAVALHAGPGITPARVAFFERIDSLRRDTGVVIDPTALRLRANAAIARRAFAEADEIGLELLDRAGATGDAVLLTEGHYVRGVSNFWLGRLDGSRFHLREALAAYDPRSSARHTTDFAQDPNAVCLVRLAMTTCHLGDGPTAVRLRDAALAAAEALGHDFTLGYVRAYAAWMAADVGDLAFLRRTAACPLTAEPHVLVETTSECLAAWVRTFDADPAPALGRSAEALARIRETGQLNVEVLAMLLLASALGRAGRPEEGLDLAHAGGEIAAAEIPIHLAEARRLEAELQRRCGADTALVEALYDEAAAVAAAQGSVLVARRVAWSRRHASGCPAVSAGGTTPTATSTVRRSGRDERR